MRNPTADELLEHSANTDKWGFIGEAKPNASNPGSPVSMLVANLPVWMARTWTINMAKFRYQTGALTASPNTTFDNVDPQTTADIKIRLDWGVGDASESALIDYPYTGGTFQIHGATVRVYLVSTNFINATRPPLLNLWMSPTQSGRGSADILSPTYTRTGQSVLPSSTNDYAIPARAVGYRIAVTDGNSGLDKLVVSQFAGGAGTVQALDYSNESQITSQIVGGFLWPNRGLFIPLVNTASFMRIQNLDPTNILSFQLQFMLDLG